jgi:protein MpaA
MAPAVPSVCDGWRWFLLIGGVHGDEIEGIWAAESMIEGLKNEHPYENVGVVVWPQANPDGTAASQRWNKNHVDLNRNMPTKDWTPQAINPRYPPGNAPASEPETKAMVDLITRIEPLAILSAHSFDKPQVNANGPSLEWAKEISALTETPVTTDIGYPTPGSLGTYAGAERKIPTITLEILRGQSQESVVALYTMVIATAISYWDDKLGAS